MYEPNNNLELVGWTRKVLICAGFWNFPITENSFLKFCFYIYSIVMRYGMLFFSFTLGAELVRLLVQHYEWVHITSSLGVVVNAAKISTKVIIFIKYDVLSLFKDIMEKENDVWTSGCKEIKKMYWKKVWFCRICTILIGGSTMLVIGLLAGLGAMGTLKIKEYNQQNNASLESHLMYQTIIPLNKLDHIWWLFSIQAFWCWLGITYNLSTHMIFITILTYADSQLAILQIRIRNYVGPEFSEESSKLEIQEKVQDLKKLVLDHKYIIGYIENFNSSAKYIILMEFVLSSLDLASASASVIKMDSSEMGWLLMFVTLLSLQIFLLGWTCNQIVVQSMAIGNALYESKWYLLNKEAKQLTQIMIARAQKPLRMTIGPFGPMTNESAVMVIKAAYSYISVIRK